MVTLKTLKISMALSSILLMPLNVFAFGSVVTDIQAYTYYAQQIELATSNLKKIEEQIKLATDTYNQVSSIDDNLKGNYQRALGAVRKFKDLKDLDDLSEFSKIRRSIQFADGRLTDLLDSEEYAGDIDKNIDKIFGDGSSEWTQLSAIKSKKQRGYKNTIINAELAQEQARLQLETLDEYANLVNTTTTSKDAQDAGNTLMLQMLDNQRQMIILMGEVSKNLAIAAYDASEKKDFNPVNSKGKKITDFNRYDMKPLGDLSLSGCKGNSSTLCNLKLPSPVGE